MQELDYDKIDDVVVEGIDHSDSPDYVDAYIASAKYDDPVNGYRDLTEDELESLEILIFHLFRDEFVEKYLTSAC